MLLTGKRVPLAREAFEPGLAAQYDQHARRFMGPIYRDLARQFRSLAGLEGQILDVGSGSALLAVELALTPGARYSITALDLSPEMLKLARSNLQKAGLDDKITLRLGSAANLAFADSSFDFVVSNASLHSWREPLAVLNEIGRVLKAGGLGLIRDNMRVPYLLFPAIEMASRCQGMNPAQRQLWWRAIGASYTPAEVRRLLKNAGWHGARVNLNVRFLDLTICWFKRR
jgi:ubiquinone/menaquinone biosynthesis C-methylase UbiE